MNTQVYIEDYRLDITNELSALLNFAIDDIKDFSSRSTTWSKTIVLPGTSNNNKVFGHIFQPGRSNEHDPSAANVNYNFNAAKSANCIIFQDQIQTFKGVLRLLQINILNGVIEYEVSVFGKLAGLNVALSGGLIENLDFSAYNHTYNDANIVASWDNPGGSGYYYPLIDYGTYSTDKHNWDIRTFRPALYVREYIDKMITAAGFRWSSALMDTPRFKSQIIPHAKKQMTVGLTELFTATDALSFYGTPPVNTTQGTVPVRFTVTSGTGFIPNAGPDKIQFTFNGTVTTNIEIRFLFEINSFLDPGNTGPGVGLIDIWKNAEFDVNGNPTAGTFINRQTWTGAGAATVGTGIVLNISISPGDTLDFRLSQEGFFSGQLDNVTFNTSYFNVKSAGGATVAVPITIGDTVKLSDNIPQNIRQIDFLVGIVKLYNLYVYEDKFDTTLIHLTPYIDYYSKNTANAVDWTQKLNRNKAIKIKPMAELNAKVYKFKFKSDSDYYNDLYRKRYNEGYGDRIYDSQYEFTSQENSFEIVFSGTPLVGYGGEAKVYPTIFKRTGPDTLPVEENTDSNIRILQSKKITSVASWNIKDGPAVDDPILTTLTRYGYAGHLDDPNTPTTDLNFGATKELFFVLTGGSLSNNQFNAYWSNYMAEITDKNSKLVTANFYLNTKDILNLDFSKYVYVDGVAYRLNAIKDYDVSKPNDCVVELFRVNAPSYSEVPSNDGPPIGCYLLWSDEQTLDWDDGEHLLYGPCNDNPGDGEDPEPGTVYYLNWSFTNFAVRIGFMKIFVNGTLQVSAGPANASGSFPITAGQSIQVEVIGSPPRVKSLLITNTIEGSIFTNSSADPSVTHTFTVLADRDYSATGTMTNS